MAELSRDQEGKFREVLESLRLIAEAEENVISEKKIRENFQNEGIKLDNDQFQLVCNYLKQENVSISEGRKSSSMISEDATQEERDEQFFSMYKHDLRGVRKLFAEEMEELIKDIPGNKDALIQAFLRDVIHWVEPFKESGLPMCDLVQEGNLGLMMGLAQFEGTNVQELRKCLKESVVDAVRSALVDEEGYENLSMKILTRVNAVNDCARTMAEDLGRKVTFAELAKQLNMTEEELKDIDELSGYKLENIEKHQ